MELPKLIFKDRDDLPSHTVELRDGIYTVGRAGDSRLVIPHGSISGHHCEILVHSPEIIIRDGGSKNGTYINGVRVKGQMPVKSGQTVVFGIVRAELQLPPLPLPGRDETYETAVFDHRRYVSNQSNPSEQPPPASEKIPALPFSSDSAVIDATIEHFDSGLHSPSAALAGDRPKQETINLGGHATERIRRSGSIWFYVLLIMLAVVLFWALRRTS